MVLEIEGEEIKVSLYERKRTRSFHLSFDHEKGNFIYVVPFFSSKKEREDTLRTLYLRFQKNHPQYLEKKIAKGDFVWIFGKKEKINGWSLMSEASRISYLKKRFLSYLEEAVPRLSSLMGDQIPHRITIGTYRSIYGSNYAKTGTITFSLSLVHYLPEIIDSVILHELVHDYVRNHGEKFYALLLKYCPDYAKFRNALIQLDYEGNTYGKN